MGPLHSTVPVRTGRIHKRGSPYSLCVLLIALLVSVVGFAPGNLASANPVATARGSTTVDNSSTNIGCHHISTMVPPSFRSRTFQFAGAASARSCANGNGSYATRSGVQWNMGMSNNRTISFVSSGAHWVKVTWRFAWSLVSRAYVQRICSGTPPSPVSYAFLSCQATAGVDFDAYPYVVDLSNGTRYSPPHQYLGSLNLSGTEYNDACYFTCSTSTYSLGANNSTHGAARVSFDIDVSNGNSAHSYGLVMGVEGQILLVVNTNFYNFTGVVRLLGDSMGKIDLASPRHGATLLHLTVT